MLAATDKFKANLLGTHQPVIKAGVWLPNGSGTYVLEGYLGVQDGSLTIDGRRNIRRQATLTLSSLTATADGVFVQDFDSRDYLEALTTQSAELTLEWGLRFPDLTEETVTIARLRVEESARSATSAALQVNAAYDLGGRVADFNLVTPYAPYSLAGTKLTYVQAIQDLVNAAYPSANPPTWSIAAGVDTTSLPPDSTVFTGDRWGAVNALAQAINAVVLVQADGTWAIRPATTSTDHVWTVSYGASGVLVDQSTAFSRREQYNAVAIRWENPTGGGGLAYVVDNDPASPTYYDGPFGKKPRPEETLDTVTSSTQAVAAATTLLEQYRGITRSVSLTSVHNPLLEAGDVIALFLPDGSAERHIIDSITLPLAGGTMLMETRILRSGITYNAAIAYQATGYRYDGNTV